MPLRAYWKAKLEAGYHGFREGDYIKQKMLYENLGTDGQQPKIMLIACSDSRVDPTDIFNAYPGEMFVVRNVANIVPPLDETSGYHGTSAAIEYAVKNLEVQEIVVLGHESCGGIKGCLYRSLMMCVSASWPEICPKMKSSLKWNSKASESRLRTS